MEQVVPWRELGALVEPHYPKRATGRPPWRERMLRIYFLQQVVQSSGPAVEELVRLGGACGSSWALIWAAKPVPDETTVCKFRHLLEAHDLGEQMLGTVNLPPAGEGGADTTGTIRETRPSFTRPLDQDREGQRDPRCTRRGREAVVFGMKATWEWTSKHKLIHTAVVTAANVADAAMLPDLLHGEETRCGVTGLSGTNAGNPRVCPGAQDYTQRRCPLQDEIVDAVAWRRTGPSRKCGPRWNTCLDAKAEVWGS